MRVEQGLLVRGKTIKWLIMDWELVELEHLLTGK